METIRQFLWEHVATYSVMAAIGIIAVFVCALILCMKRDQNWVRQLFIMIASLAGLLLGAKLFGMISYATHLYERGESLAFSFDFLKRLFNNSGIVFYGGLLGYFLTFWVLSKYLLPRKRLGRDIVAVTVPLFHGFARIGCYLGRDYNDFGEIVWHPCCYGVKMENSAFCSHFWDSRLPVQLIESAFNFLLFAVLLILFLRETKDERRGRMIFLYMPAYAVFRFIIEFFRGDAVRGGFGPLSFSQVVSLLILLWLIVFMILRKTGVIKPLPIDPYDPGVDLYRLGKPKAPHEPIVFYEGDDVEEKEDSSPKDA
jgi:phosphatidylglycerol:prolipoprotein diacylglycerol transferase